MCPTKHKHTTSYSVFVYNPACKGGMSINKFYGKQRSCATTSLCSVQSMYFRRHIPQHAIQHCVGEYCLRRHYALLPRLSRQRSPPMFLEPLIISLTHPEIRNPPHTPTLTCDQPATSDRQSGPKFSPDTTPPSTTSTAAAATRSHNAPIASGSFRLESQFAEAFFPLSAPRDTSRLFFLPTESPLAPPAAEEIFPSEDMCWPLAAVLLPLSLSPSRYRFKRLSTCRCPFVCLNRVTSSRMVYCGQHVSCITGWALPVARYKSNASDKKQLSAGRCGLYAFGVIKRMATTWLCTWLCIIA